MSQTMTKEAVRGRFGEFGGRYVPETLFAALDELSLAYDAVREDAAFHAELDALLRAGAERVGVTGIPAYPTEVACLSALVGQALPGDVVGLVGHSDFRIGDTLSENPDLAYDEIPRFPPEVTSSNSA